MVRSRTVHIAVGNGRHYGGGMTVSERSRIDDGTLDVFSLEVGSFWRLLLLLPALRRGDHGRWHEVRTAEGAGGGDPHPPPPRRQHRRRDHHPHPVVFRVLHGAARVFVPAAAEAAAQRAAPARMTPAPSRQSAAPARSQAVGTRPSTAQSQNSDAAMYTPP